MACGTSMAPTARPAPRSAKNVSRETSGRRWRRRPACSAEGYREVPIQELRPGPSTRRGRGRARQLGSGGLDHVGPGAVAADDVADVAETSGSEQRRGDRGAVAAGAVDDRGATGVELVEAGGKLPDGDVHRMGHGAEGVFARVADVDELDVAQFTASFLEVDRREAGRDLGVLGVRLEDLEGRLDRKSVV